MRYDFIALLAKEKAGLPESMHSSGWEDFTHEGMDALKLEFCDAPLITRGKRKGQPNWRKFTNRKFVWITGEEIKTRAAEWEKRTGKCAECEGTAQVFLSWNHETGTKYQPCNKCNATGKAA